MTEKRFTKQEVYNGINRYKINESNFIVEILDDGIPMHYSTIVNRLNEQDKTITRLEKKNEQLKSTINTLTHDNTKMKKVLNTTKNENEQIKHHIKEAYHNERTHIGKSVLKQLLNNIEAIQ